MNQVKTGQRWQTHWYCGSPFPSLTVPCGAALSGSSSARTQESVWTNSHYGTCWVNAQIQGKNPSVKMPCSINSISHTSRDFILHCGAPPILLVTILCWFTQWYKTVYRQTLHIKTTPISTIFFSFRRKKCIFHNKFDYSFSIVIIECHFWFISRFDVNGKREKSPLNTCL